jgi:linoleate 9S-lipoxygenase
MFLLTDPNSESRIPLLMSLDIYVPRDERFGHLKMSDFLAYALKSLVQFIRPELQALFDKTPSEFDSFQDVYNLYEGGIPLPEGFLKDISDNIPLPMIKEIFRTDGEQFLRFPVPKVIESRGLYIVYISRHILYVIFNYIYYF